MGSIQLPVTPCAGHNTGTGGDMAEGDMIMKNEKLIVDTFNNYFADITKALKLKKHSDVDGQTLSSVTDYFKNNESVINIKEKYDTQENSFLFTLFSKEDS